MLHSRKGIFVFIFNDEQAHIMKNETILIFIAICLSQFTSCKEKSLPITPEISYSNDICYMRDFNGNWDICINSINGDALQNISNSPWQDSDLSWSSNGKFIAYTHFNNSQYTDIYLFDVEKKQTINLTPDNEYEAYAPRWTPDGKKIIFSYHTIGQNRYTYIMNYDGTDKKKILDFEATVYFYSDNYRFIYRPIGTYSNMEGV